MTNQEQQHSTPLVNRVAQSGLVTLDLEDYYPKGEVVAFDLKPFLFMELILKEKDFRERLENMDWSEYAGKQKHPPGFQSGLAALA